jgi:hypothetical protein
MKNPLQYLPPSVRTWVYLVLGLVALAIGAYQASDGDWLQAVALLLGSLGFATARTHVDKP